MTILGIDPGNEQSAYVLLHDGKPLAFGKFTNHDMLSGLDKRSWENPKPKHLAIETMHARGMPTAQEEFETQLWAGRFIERAGLPFTQMRRLDVKLHLCGSARAKDTNIRQALIDRFGGSTAIGKKKSQGPLYGISGDCWSALAVAITYAETLATRTEPRP